ncbi:MAG: posphoenolpyruvate synthetase regulatory kinase/phosphorylase PpsR [Burkholderiaceae bacterium]|jgi:regulator of PEP synthase PpsR (kinase-PPPase family)
MTQQVQAAGRTAFFVSDGTGITAETLASSILAQFDQLKFKLRRLPFIDSIDKADQASLVIAQQGEEDGRKPIVFSTLVNPAISARIKQAEALHLDLFQTFVVPLEAELGVKSSHTIGRFHHATDSDAYKNRIEAINFSLAHDDGQSSRNLDQAEVILLGVSRSGKTPTSLYLSMQYGIKVANYPLIPDDFERNALPAAIAPYLRKCFGLTIDPMRLSDIRNERRPGSKYAALENCRYEVDAAERMMKRDGIPWLSTTTKSIEEIATTILSSLALGR